ncbi:MAG: hypothetical protein ACYCSA_07125 [Thermoplasmataceae archaeon]
MKCVNREVKTKYICYLKKNPNSGREITGKDILHYVERLLDAEI